MLFVCNKPSHFLSFSLLACQWKQTAARLQSK